MFRLNLRRESPRGWAVLSGVLVAACELIGGCGGGSSSTPPSPDFAITLNPSSLTQTVGTISPPVTVTISAKNGFADTINVAIQSLPNGAISVPPAPLSIPVSGSQQVTFFFPPATATGPIPLSFAASGGGLSHTATLNITLNPVSGTATLVDTNGQVDPGTIEIQGLSAGDFNPAYWQNNSLNWVPDVRVPMLAPQTNGPCQNIYAPWALEQSTGWRLFYGGWDGSTTCNDRVYSLTTQDFLSFQNRVLVIDHGDFVHVNNENVSQLPDGSMHMICTVAPDQTGNDKPAYFSSPDGITWNGTAEPYSVRLSDIVSIPNDPNYSGWDFNGGNVLLWDETAWVLYYSVGIYGGIGQVYRATASSPPTFQQTGVALNTQHYANDIKKFSVGGKAWYLALLYTERATTDPAAPMLTYSLSNDGVTFAPEQNLFSGATAADKFLMTPSFATRGDSILGVLYGGNAIDLLASNQIFGRWLQKKVVITDTSGVQYFAQGSYGPDRQWFSVPASGTLDGTMVVYAEDGVTTLASSLVRVTAGKDYRLSLP